VDTLAQAVSQAFLDIQAQLELQDIQAQLELQDIQAQVVHLVLVVTQEQVELQAILVEAGIQVQSALVGTQASVAIRVL
jgi:hypothetical protein